MNKNELFYFLKPPKEIILTAILIIFLLLANDRNVFAENESENTGNKDKITAKIEAIVPERKKHNNVSIDIQGKIRIDTGKDKQTNKQKLNSIKKKEAQKPVIKPIICNVNKPKQKQPARPITLYLPYRFLNVKHSIHIYFDEMKFINLALHFGHKRIYGIFLSGINASSAVVPLGLGTGTTIDFNRWASMAIELTGETLGIKNEYFRDGFSNLLARLRFAFHIKINSHFAITTGLTYNYFFLLKTKNTDSNSSSSSSSSEQYTYDNCRNHYEPADQEIVPEKSRFPWGNDNNIHWAGCFIGIQVSFGPASKINKLKLR